MAIKIEWLGHACFRITGSDGTRVLIDPFDNSLGYRIPDYSCEVLLITHDHFDHNAEKFVRSEHKTFRTEGRKNIDGIPVESKTFSHDEAGGSKRGKTLAFKFKVDGLTFAHLGDMGAIPDAAGMAFFKDVDCMMIPIGGYFTIDAAQATKIANQVNPAYVFPMHYKTRYVTLPIGNVEDFEKGKSDVIRVAAGQFTIDPENMPERMTIIIMDVA
jgi:L-ascorbate metabolism protein UlaG (beta-lactamase superfamily)